MKANTAFIYALRIWLSTLLVGSVFAISLLFLEQQAVLFSGVLAGIAFAWVYVGVHTLPMLLGLFLVFLVLPTRENNSIVQKVIYGILIILMIALTAHFLLPKVQRTIFDALSVVAYVIVAIIAMLYFYPKGINIDTYKKDNNILDGDL